MSSTKQRSLKRTALKSQKQGNTTSKAPTVSRALSRLALIIAVVLGLSIAIAGTTYAYLTLATEAANNPFAAPEVRAVLLENGQEIAQDQTTPEREVALGADTKQVQIQNPESGADFAVRLTFSPQILAEESTSESPVYEYFDSGLISEPVNNTVVMGSITLHFAEGWQNDWFFDNGFFYYNTILAAGETTPALLVGVTTDLSDEDIKVLVSYEAIQAYPNQAREVWGVSIS